MSLQDSLYNWLSIKVVHEARPDDSAAEETFHSFQHLLEKEHGLSRLKVSKKDDMYSVTYRKDGEELTSSFPADLIECMLNSILENPERFKNYH
ncbi:hypothetical protein [Bacillus testis]|uniref:hypothetical protein n=1 Tax=Bacillus testis TaxID=1622072 RepID=UPI000AE8BDD6|nr:hypothetical protein [Bacillus testis]